MCSKRREITHELHTKRAQWHPSHHTKNRAPPTPTTEHLFAAPVSPLPPKSLKPKEKHKHGVAKLSANKTPVFSTTSKARSAKAHARAPTMTTSTGLISKSLAVKTSCMTPYASATLIEKLERLILKATEIF